MKDLFSHKAALIAITFALMATAILVAMVPSPPVASRFEAASTRQLTEQDAATAVDEGLVPEHRQASPKPSPSPPPPPSPKPKPKPAPKPLIIRNVDVYRGLGAWIDVYDSSLDVTTTIAEMSRRGVKTLYLETSSWKFSTDLQNQAMVDAYLKAAHAKGIRVVGWYLPGFADMDRDVRRSVFVLQYKSSQGESFDGFATDIESRVELNQDRDRFNAAVVEYSNRLRAALPTATLGAIVVDAKNNERAPSRWEGFPWPDIGKTYDVIMPMAYWSVNPANGGCPGADIDTFSYMGEVVSKTQALMGTKKPMHLIGGIADCISVVETHGYVQAMKSLGSLGGSLYDFATTQSNPNHDAIWAELAGLN
jgi:hypothetical protein